MQWLPIALGAIVVLAVIFLVISKFKFGRVLTNIVVWPQVAMTISTLALAIIAAYYAYTTTKMVNLTQQTINEMSKARETQEKLALQSIQTSEKMIEEMKLAREQQFKPYIFVHFHWDENLDKFFSITKNIGAGAARDIEYSYFYKGEEFKNHYKTLAPGEEVVDSSIFGRKHIGIKEPIKIEVRYRDSFDNTIKEEFRHNLKKLTDEPLPSRFSEIRKDEESAAWQKGIEKGINKFHQSMDSLNKRLKEIKEQLNRDRRVELIDERGVDDERTIIRR